LVSIETAGKVLAAVEHEGGYIELGSLGLPETMRSFLAIGPEGIERLRDALGSKRGIAHDPRHVRVKAPVPDPPKVICVGLNYRDHAKESGSEVPDEPVFFNKFPTAVIGPDEPIELPPVSSQVDYEAELVVVIGRGGKRIDRSTAYEHVAGYTCGHDVSARDWQLHKPGKQWLCGKSFDTFAPIGPAIVTADELADPHSLDIRFRLNGQVLQESNTRELIFPVDELVAYISQVATLEPGDLLFTGTPPGVGYARKPQVFLKPGDLCEVEIESIGVLRNPVV
jgi:2-keto-4-pentenoate hydratase/2-oxohepta-3-ene-1,7-dioic acid hydratase in catechol pathway